MTYRLSSAKRRQVYSIPGVFNDRVEGSESENINVSPDVRQTVSRLDLTSEIDSFDLRPSGISRATFMTTVAIK